MILIFIGGTLLLSILLQLLCFWYRSNVIDPVDEEQKEKYEYLDEFRFFDN